MMRTIARLSVCLGLVFLITLASPDVLGERPWTYDTSGLLPVQLDLNAAEVALWEKLHSGETAAVSAGCADLMKSGKASLASAWMYVQCARVRHTATEDLGRVEAICRNSPQDRVAAYARFKLISLSLWATPPNLQDSLRTRLDSLRSDLVRMAGNSLPIIASCAFDGIPGIQRSREILESFKPAKQDEGRYWLLMARAYVNGAVFLDSKGLPVDPPKGPDVSAMLSKPSEARSCAGKAQAQGAPMGLVRFYVGRSYLAEKKTTEAKQALQEALQDRALPKLVRSAIVAYLQTGNPMVFNSKILE